MADLFDFKYDDTPTNAPLADRMRPRTLDEFLGQRHLIFDGSLLSRAIKADKLGSCIFFGPPGIGKTTLAAIIANTTKGEFEKLNAVTSGVADAKRVIEKAKDTLRMYGKKTYLLLDECHRWNKAQSDCVLSAIEDGSIIFIGSTTENPNLAMTRAIVSRCRIFELKPLLDEDVTTGLKRAVCDAKRGYGNLTLDISDEAYARFVWAAAGDMRNAYNGLELAVLTTLPDENGTIAIDAEVAAHSMQTKNISLDESTYFDMLSAYCKSLRGSDANAALYWAFRLVASGLDPLIIFRRTIAHASEDVGMADSGALSFVVRAMQAYERIGMPEGELPLAHAVIRVATAPKSNAVLNAKEAAKAAVKETGASFVPLHLRNTQFSSLDKSEVPYKYAHDYGGYVRQQYLPDNLKNYTFYHPSDNGDERAVKQFLNEIDQIMDKSDKK